MPRFFIEVPHEGSAAECARAVEIFLRTGSHFLTRAEWGCFDGDHNAWMIVDVGSKEEARTIVPSAYRSEAKIIQLNTFTLEQVPELRRQHSS
jgi:hypothetical protein